VHSTRVARFFLIQYTNTEKIYQMAINIPNSCKIDQIAIKYINSFHCKTLQNLPEFGFLVWKYTIWQPRIPPKKVLFQNVDRTLHLLDVAQQTQLSCNQT
jgi:hypothetical protein